MLTKIDKSMDILLSEYLPMASKLEDNINSFFKKRGINATVDCFNCSSDGKGFEFSIDVYKSTNVSKIFNSKQDLRLYLEVNTLEINDNGNHLTLSLSYATPKPKNTISVLRGSDYKRARYEMKIALPIGTDNTGSIYAYDITKLPHQIVSGSTRSGKTVFLKSLITSLVTYSPEKVRLIICDKANDLSSASKAYHCACQLIDDNHRFLLCLLIIKDEMERRLKLKGTPEFDKLSNILLIVDEFPAFMDNENAYERQLAIYTLKSILRRARHIGINVILAVNDPKKENIGIDISDIPARISFLVSNVHNSVTAIGFGGAEKLRGDGDMYFSMGATRQRLQGLYISDEQFLSVIKRVSPASNRESLIHATKFCSLKLNKTSRKSNQFIITDYDFMYKDKELEAELATALPVTKKGNQSSRNKVDSLLPDAIIYALERDTISCNALKTSFNVGWNRANKLINYLHEIGIVNDPGSTLPRDVLSKCIDDVPHAAMELLAKYGYSKDDISAIINRRELS